ncbi:hypothetical protein D3C79_1046740 [compost metagenome]
MRENTLPGWRAKKYSRSNSRGVRSRRRPSRDTSRVIGSMARPSMSKLPASIFRLRAMASTRRSNALTRATSSSMENGLAR